MTARLYYDDSYTTDFMARVVEQTAVEGHPAVVLDRSYFYPTCGGQPFDTGTINGVHGTSGCDFHAPTGTITVTATGKVNGTVS